jgi:hypothetical protein
MSHFRRLMSHFRLLRVSETDRKWDMGEGRLTKSRYIVLSFQDAIYLESHQE